MENWFMVMVSLMVALQHSCQASTNPQFDLPLWLSIDCGATSTYQDDLNTDLTWRTDDGFIKTGENNFLTSANTSFVQMKTLRSFPTGDRNCYSLPLREQTKYLVRAGFFYGNYDSLLRLPSFVLEVYGYANVTVTISTEDTEPVYHEFILTTKEGVVDVCLVRTEENRTPFISSLEATYIDTDSNGSPYPVTTNKTALYLESRINYGANQSVPERFNFSAEMYNRIWKREQAQVPPPSYRSVSDTRWPYDYATYVDNYPPFAILANCIEAPTSSDSIFLPIKFHRNEPLSAYFIFYFAVVPHRQQQNETRNVTVYIDGHEKSTTFVPYWYVVPEASVVSLYPVNITGGAANVTIAAARGSVYPPVLSAMEVFTAYETSNSKAGNRHHQIQFTGAFVVFVFVFFWTL